MRPGRRQALAGLALLLGGCDGWSDGPPPEPPAPPPPGSVPRGEPARRAALAGPGPEVTPALLARGAERYGIFCAPCHGPAGMGDGAVVARGFPRPAPIAGWMAERSMTALSDPAAGSHPFDDRIAPGDRWAIARFVASLPRDAVR